MSTSTKFNARGGVSILELGIYGPSLVIAAIVCSRHGFGRASGWIYTLILCLVRVIGACCQLTTYHSQSHGLLEATVILDTIGLAPLLLATLGLLSRSFDSINEASGSFFNMVHFRLLQLLVSLGLILSIVGGTSSISSSGVYTAQTTSKAGAILYVVAYLALCLVTVVAVLKISSVRHGDSRLVWAVVVAMPFIFVRLVYTVLSVFKHDHDFSVISGSVIVLVFMAIVEEILVILTYLFVGWTTESAPRTAKGAIESRPWKGNMTAGGGQRGSRMARQGPIHGLVGMALAAGNRGDVERA